MWSLLNPALQLVVFGVVFGVIFKSAIPQFPTGPDFAGVAG